MFAFLCKEGAAEIMSQAAGIFDVQQVTKMSMLLSLREAGDLEGVWVDKRLQVADSVRHHLPDTPLFEFESLFLVSDVMRWFSKECAAKEEKTTSTLVNLVAEEVEEPRAQLIDSEDGALANPSRWTKPLTSRGRRVPVFMLDSPKGGEGRSTVGAHMAYYGAMQGKRVAVIDLDPQGNIANMLGLLDPVDARGWRGESVEQAIREGVCIVHESGLHIFPSPQSEEVVLQSPDDALYLLEMCLEEFDVVFLDMPQGWTPIHTEVLPYVTALFMVASPTVDRLDRIQEHMEKIYHALLEGQVVYPIVNKSRGRSDLKGMAQYLVPFEPHLAIPFDPLLAKKGGLHGKKLIRVCKNWWDDMYALRKAEAAKRRFRFFRRARGAWS